MDDRDRELVALLRKAARLVRSRADVHSDYYSRAEDFAKDIDHLADLIQWQDASVLAKARAFIARKKAKYTWSSPTFDLDDYLAGAEVGPEFGDAIHSML